MDSLRRTALVAGGFYVATFVSIPTLALYGAIHDPNYIVGPGPDTPVLWGGLLEVIVAIAGIGTAITLYPVARRQNEGLALGFVAARVLEAALILVGVAALLAVVTLRQDTVGGDPTSMITTGRALVALYDAAFLVSQGFIPGLNALLLGTVLYRSGLVPRAIPLLGLVGAPFFLAAKVAAILGVVDQFSAVPAITTIPIAAWELSLGLWLLLKGFTPSPLTDGVETVQAVPGVD